MAGRRRWLSSRWPLRREHLYLVPGDSPLGLRLPLSSLPWVAPADQDQPHPPDPFDARAPLDETVESRWAGAGRGAARDDVAGWASPRAR